MARILLAEDDDSMRRFLGLALERAGHDVDTVADGLEAMEALEAFSYDLLLADIVMPGMDGIELARRAHTVDAGMKIIFITGFAAIALSRRASVPQNTGILSKPFHLRDLVTQIETALAA